jgi:RNA polymerase sigma factor (TIGR02999 family)
MDDLDSEIAAWLAAWESGDRSQLSRLPEALYGEIRRLAVRRLSRERSNHTLQATALSNEVFLHLMKVKHVRFEGKADFMKLVAHMMRNILVDYARKRRVREGYSQRVPLDEVNSSLRQLPMEDIVAVDTALEKLAMLDERMVKIVELRHCLGLTVEQVAAILQTSKATVEREWRIAKSFLLAEITKGANTL